jgi:hypothetical protein
MKKFAAVFLSLLFVLPLSADPFDNNDLFLAKTVKIPKKLEFFSAGVELQIALVKAIVKSQMDTIKAEACKGTADPKTCEGQVDTIITFAKILPEGLIKDAVNDPNLLKKAILESGALTPEQQKQVESYIPKSEDQDAFRILAETILDKEKAITFSIEPFLRMNFNLMQATGKVPIAGFYMKNNTEFVMGNINFDAKFGHIWNLGFGAAGLSYGASMYLPTGTPRANSLGLSNIFAGPKFYHEYFTLSPYFVAGYDLYFLIFQADAELYNMIAARGDPAISYPVYLQYGLGVSLVPIPFLIITGELNGVADVKDAPAMNGKFLTGGIKLNFIVMRLGVAVQVPLSQQGQDEFAKFGGMSFGSPSKINVIMNGDINW